MYSKTSIECLETRGKKCAYAAVCESEKPKKKRGQRIMKTFLLCTNAKIREVAIPGGEENEQGYASAYVCINPHFILFSFFASLYILYILHLYGMRIRRYETKVQCGFWLHLLTQYTQSSLCCR